MRKRFLSGLLLATLIAAFVVPSGANARRTEFPRLKARPSARPPLAAPGEAVVTYRRATDRRTLAASVSTAGGRVLQRTSARAAVVATSGRVADLVTALEADPAVAYAEPNYLRYLTAIPNDPSFAQQWGLHNINQAHVVSDSSQTSSGTDDADMDVAEAWDTEQGDPETVIAIIDSGVDTTHPDLAPNLWTNPGEIAADGVDNDNNGLIDDVNGWDFAENDATVYEPNSAFFGHDHGTHVAGIAAAAMNNGVGIAGVCPTCRIMVLKTFEPFDLEDDIPGKDTMIGKLGAEIDAINYAVEMGATVINGSFASSAWSKSERAALNRASNAGVSLVFAASNSNLDNDLFLARDDDGDGVFDVASPEYPASYDLPSLISVGATNDLDRNGYSTACATATGSPDFPCSFTNWGHDSVDLSAPGVDIFSTLPNATYAAFDGTSMASPAIAGVVGLLRSAFPSYAPAQVRNALMNSVDRPAGLATLFAFPNAPATGQFTLTGGRANAAAALTASTASNFPVTDGNVRGAQRIYSFKSGNVAWPHDVNDVYKKRLRGNRNYKVVLNGPGGADFDLLIYSPGTKEIWQIQGGCYGFAGECKLVAFPGQGDADETAKFTAPSTGKYYFQVAAFPGFSGNYTLKITRI